MKELGFHTYRKDRRNQQPSHSQQLKEQLMNRKSIQLASTAALEKFQAELGKAQEEYRVAHNRVVELGHFIAKIEDDYMQAYLRKFNEQYKGKQSIEIEFFNKFEC